MTLDDKKHKKCAVCDKRLDRVKYWNIVQKEELILKLNKLKEGVKKNDSVCSTCTDRSRRLFVDNVETMQYDVESNQNDEHCNHCGDCSNQNDNYQNNQSTVLIQNDNISCEMNSEDIDDYSSECSSTTLGSTESIQDSIYVDLARTNSTEKKCVICNKKRGKKNNKLHRLSDKSVTDAYIKTSILIPFGSRACKIHVDENSFLEKSCLGITLFYIHFYNFK
jgi:hypothetical protein